jgi:hypothetical protein
MGGAYSTYGREDIWWGKPEGKAPLRRSKRRREDNIRMEVKGIGWKRVDWVDLPQNRDE